MFNQLIQYFHDHFQNVLPTEKVTLEGGGMGFSWGNLLGGSRLFSQTWTASDEVQAISKSIQTTADAVYATDIYSYAMQYDCAREKRKVTDYLNSAAFKKAKSQWAKFGIHELTSADEPVKQDHVGIYIERDEENLVCRFKVKSNFARQGAAFDLELTEMPTEIERIRKFNLIYMKDLRSLTEEFESLTEKLQNANNPQRLNLLNQFNEKYKDQLTATLTCDLDSEESIIKLTDVSGKKVANSTFTDRLSIFRGIDEKQQLRLEGADATSTYSERMTHALKENAAAIIGVSLALASEYLAHQYINEPVRLLSQTPRLALCMYTGIKFQQWINKSAETIDTRTQPRLS